jgi:hypothetical protein
MAITRDGNNIAGTSDEILKSRKDGEIMLHKRGLPIILGCGMDTITEGKSHKAIPKHFFKGYIVSLSIATDDIQKIYTLENLLNPTKESWNDFLHRTPEELIFQVHFDK